MMSAPQPITTADPAGGFKMRCLKYVVLLALFMVPVGAAHAQRFAVGVGVGPIDPAPVCAYGYYPYTPYACAPYGYWGPDYFVDGVFIGAGPWFHAFYGGRGFYGRDRGFSGRGGFRGNNGFRVGAVGPRGGSGFRGGAAPHAGGGFHGGGGAVRGGGGGFHGGGGGHGGGHR